MKRREIFKLALGAALLHSLPGRAWAQMHHGTMPMMGHQEHNALMPLERMPGGRALRPLLPLTNTSSEPGHFQARLTAAAHTVILADGKKTQVWLYNGQMPGPLIELKEGDQLDIEFVNQLDQATTVHWHGLPVPPEQDGNPQDPVAPGQSRHYRFTLPEGSAGTYWYHPHPHGKTGEQVAHGLAGALIVRAADDPLAGVPEQHWVISDLRLDSDGQIPANTPMDWMNGREGQFVLINGQHQPRMRVSTGERIRVWNACAARYLRLHIPGARLVQIGTDGGLLQVPLAPSDEVFLAPAERAELFVLTEQSGPSTLQALYYDRQKMMVQEEPHTLTLAQIDVRTEPFSLPPRLRDIAAAPQGDVDARVVFSEVMPMNHATMGEGMNHGSHGSMPGMPDMAAMRNMFRVNDRIYDMQRIDLRCPVGQWQRWEVVNDSHMDHPFHLHGTQFQVLSRATGGKTTPEPFRAWRDTVNLRPNETVTLAFRQDVPGLRMFHCHILEHEDLGMMAQLMVE
ncbi:MAG TPA: multicopper oxidase family protein [Alcaligenes sp.]|nr:multicopper oxidase family protein [Alcaligenes faecalis]HRL20288.1 multicopper oxidase family protein [Alcaligenes sp.]